MRRMWKKIAGYFLTSVIFISAILLSVSFALTNNLKASKSENSNDTEISWPKVADKTYPLQKESNIYYRWSNISKYITKKDLFKYIFNINHFYDNRIDIISQDNLKKNLSSLIKAAIDKDPYFQKKSKKLQKINISYKAGEPMKVNCLFTFDESYNNKKVYYYDQFSIAASQAN